MSLISFIVALQLITFYPAFAESPAVYVGEGEVHVGKPLPRQPKSPYKVTGVACLKGEYCQKITKGEYKGYYIKANIPLNDPRTKKIRGNMFTKALLGSMLEKEKRKNNRKIRELQTLAQSCQGDLCIVRWDNKGCNGCTLNFSRVRSRTITYPDGSVAIVDPHPDAIDDINYLCQKRGCVGNEGIRSRRAGTCAKYGPNPLPPVIIDTLKWGGDNEHEHDSAPGGSIQ